MRTRLESADDGVDGVRIRCVETGQSVQLADVGRCFRLYRDDDGPSINIARGNGWNATLRRVRQWLRDGDLPVRDMHMPDLR